MKPLTLLRWLLLLTALVNSMAALQLKTVFGQAGLLVHPVWQSRLLFLQIGLPVFSVFLVVANFSPLAGKLIRWLERISNRLRKHRWLILLLVGMDAVGLLFVTMGPYYTYQAGLTVQLFWVWYAGLFAGFLLATGWRDHPISLWLAGGLSGAGFLLQTGVLFSYVTDFPFRTSWSEGMSLLNAAQFAGEKIWGQAVSWPTVNITYSLLQAFSFWMPGNHPLWFHRLWNSILWVILPLLVSWAISRRMHIRSRAGRVGFILWGYLFLSQGPLYFNLAVIPLIILLGFRSDRFSRSMVIVILASIWAGLSRINWFPLPGCLAALLYVLEIPYSGKFWSYFWRPIIWILTGTFLGVAVSQGYNILSGNPEYYSNTIMNSSLLWYRLLPSVTFSMGVILALLITTGGLVAFIIWRLFISNQVCAWRKTATAGILLVFLLGGLVVSTKIGGGDNLHNLDAFLVLLLICAGTIFSGRVIPDVGDRLVSRVPLWLMAVIVGVPLIYQMPFLPFRPPEDPVPTSQLEQVLSEKVLESQAQGKPVLFISQTQFLVIDRYPGVLPEPKYGLVWMMEMAMSGNQEYFSEFHDRLKRQEWGLIVIDSVSMDQTGREKTFGEEQTAWANWVATPLLEYYDAVDIFPSIGMILATPR